MSEIRVASRYAKSLFDLAIEKNILDKIEEDANTFLQTCEHSRAFANMLKSPVITPEKKLVVINRVFNENFNDMTKSFIRIVTRKGREMMLYRIFQQFAEMVKEHKNIITATVTTAIPLDEKLRSEIRELLEQRTNSTIDLKTKINADILGGFVLKYEDKLLDASVASQLKSLKNHLLNNN